VNFSSATNQNIRYINIGIGDPGLVEKVRLGSRRDVFSWSVVLNLDSRSCQCIYIALGYLERNLCHYSTIIPTHNGIFKGWHTRCWNQSFAPIVHSWFHALGFPSGAHRRSTVLEWARWTHAAVHTCFENTEHLALLPWQWCRRSVATEHRGTYSSLHPYFSQERSCLPSQFNQAVRVRSLVLQAQERGPETLRLRINCSAIDFTNFEDSEDTQVIGLKADQVSKEGSAKLIPLHPTKFNHVNSLHVSSAFFLLLASILWHIKQILIESDHDNTRIDAIDILGTLVQWVIHVYHKAIITFV
jgi:hypothetical protein